MAHVTPPLLRDLQDEADEIVDRLHNDPDREQWESKQFMFALKVLQMAHQRRLTDRQAVQLALWVLDEEIPEVAGPRRDYGTVTLGEVVAEVLRPKAGRHRASDRAETVSRPHRVWLGDTVEDSRWCWCTSTGDSPHRLAMYPWVDSTGVVHRG